MLFPLCKYIQISLGSPWARTSVLAPSISIFYFGDSSWLGSSSSSWLSVTGGACPGRHGTPWWWGTVPQIEPRKKKRLQESAQVKQHNRWLQDWSRLEAAMMPKTSTMYLPNKQMRSSEKRRRLRKCSCTWRCRWEAPWRRGRLRNKREKQTDLKKTRKERGGALISWVSTSACLIHSYRRSNSFGEGYM